MKILSIETSCDETSAAVIDYTQNQTPQVLSVVTSTSLAVHQKTGGIIPENAARAQVEYILPVITQALSDAFNSQSHEKAMAFSLLEKEIDYIAVTQGPGLIGSLLVGVETAKTLSYIYNKPLIPVNHLLAHIYANFLSPKLPINPFPFIGLIVSGGHTDLLVFTSHTEFKWIGGTRDDAAGEALDKIGRVLNLPYPAGPEIEKQALKATLKNIQFSRPLLGADNFDFSFSGLKTEAVRYIKKQSSIDAQHLSEICYGIQHAVADVLVKKTIKAAEHYQCSTILLGGGVSANSYLRNHFQSICKKENLPYSVYYPELSYTLDNAAMIGAYAALNNQPQSWNAVKANPELYFK